MRGSLHRLVALNGILYGMLGVLVALLATTPAWAHEATPFYPGLWATSGRGNVAVYNDSTISGVWLSRVFEGAKAWDNAGTSLNYVRIGTSALSRNACDAKDRGKNLVYKGKLDGRGHNLATTFLCRSGSMLVRFVTLFDSAEDWYTGTSKTVPAGRPDLTSIATHEFGHATGWSLHYDDPGVGLGSLICGNTSGQATMCATHYVGTARQRSLHTHDLHTFTTAY